MTQQTHAKTRQTQRIAVFSPRSARAMIFSMALAASACIAVKPVLAAPADAAAGGASADSDQRNRQFQHAEALYLSGRLKDAAAAFEALTREYPRDARIWLKYGNTLTKQNAFDEAAPAFQNAVNLDPTQGAAALNLALVRLLQAQSSLDVAVSRLAAGSAERTQAETLQRQVKSLLGGSERVAPTP
jgi:tetratricopeptide (TPR) repeat protein